MELYRYYFELMIHDGFIAYNKTLEDYIDVRKETIMNKMNEYNIRFK